MKAVLKFVGPDLQPDEISRVLGLRPSQTGRPGDPIEHINARGRPVSRPSVAGYWIYEFSGHTPTQLQAEIQTVVASVAADLAAWSRLAAAQNGSLVVHGAEPGSTARHLFGPEVLALLEQRRIAIFLNED